MLPSQLPGQMSQEEVLNQWRASLPQQDDPKARITPSPSPEKVTEGSPERAVSPPSIGMTYQII